MVGIILLYGVVAGLVWLAIGPELLPILRTTGGGNDPRLAVALAHVMPFVFVGAVVAGIGAALIGCWYSALFLRHIAGNTRLETLAFSSTDDRTSPAVAGAEQ